MQQICTKCILDDQFPGITFDSHGVCNNCHKYERVDKKYSFNESNKKFFERIIEKIKIEGKNNEYDSIVGVSGGRDSTYCLYLLKKWGLNPLAVHYDNNMDSKIAAQNIKNACNTLDIDLFTFVVDWEEYKDLQKSFLKASVPSVDIPSDHAFVTVLYEYALKNNTKYIINGSAFRTEGAIPPEWSLHNDEKFICDIQKKFGSRPLKQFPVRYLSNLIRYRLKGMTIVRPLNFVPYVHSEIMPLLEDELGWKYYGGHHFESIFTRWAFAYYLPKKFGIDKRITDYSALIRCGQMIREDALQKMNEPIYSPEQEREDRRYIMNKLELSEEEMSAILTAPPKSNFDYAHHLTYIRMLYTVLGPRHI
jgi:N-acetyl sugar amidotransferase